jgi:site-specific DNA recombinase
MEGANGALSSDPADQEAQARAWAERHGLEIAEVVTEVVSGALNAEDRKLGELIARCESGELGGIIVRDESRFARDVIAGAVALRRIVACGARLIATASGFDSAHGSEMQFNILMAVGDAERKRLRGRLQGGKLKRTREGIHCAGRVPTGYQLQDRRLVIDERSAEFIREMFRLRAQGMSFPSIAKTITSKGFPISHSSVYLIIKRRVYLGEQRVPNPEGGEPLVVKNAHPPIVTPDQWEAANAVQTPAPVRNGAGKEALLHGIARCGVCARKMHLRRYGKRREKLRYACTHPGCNGASMAAHGLEPAVQHLLADAVAARDAYVAAVIEGDTRYADALEAVHRAQRELDLYRAEIKVSDVGVEQWKADVAVRQAALEAARQALRDIPKPDEIAYPVSEYPQSPAEKSAGLIPAAVDLDMRRRFYARCIAEVRVYPKGYEPRVTLRWQGSEDHMPVPQFKAEPLPHVAQQPARP